MLDLEPKCFCSSSDHLLATGVLFWGNMASLLDTSGWWADLAWLANPVVVVNFLSQYS